jgi:lipopolysaccharide/colanic/teichoic acid biosynthesis glycosyltransferase
MARHWRALRLGVIASDVLAVIVAHSLSGGLRFGGTGVVLGAGVSPVYPVIVGAVALLIVGLGWEYGIYRRWALYGGHRVYPMLITVATFGLVAIIFLSYFLGGPPVVSRGWLIASWVFTIVLLSASRLTWRRVALRWQRQGRLVRNVLIAGANQHGIAVALQLHNPASHGRRVVGFLDDYQRPGTLVVAGLPVVGHPAAVLECARELGAEEVIIIAGALSWESQRMLAELVTSPACPVDARISPTFYDLLTTSAELSHVAYVPMVTLNRARLSGLNAAAKRLLDLTVSATLLVALVPFWAWCWVRARMHGVDMLRQEPVLGFAGHQFDVVGLHRGLVRSPVWARLPALWNVLWNDLSLVGPRPVRAREVKEHERWLANLIAMRPGLTGLWRLRPGDLPVDERVALDLYYVRNYSLTLDGQILFNTARQLVRRMLRGEAELARWHRATPAAGHVGDVERAAVGAVGRAAAVPVPPSSAMEVRH